MTPDILEESIKDRVEEALSGLTLRNSKFEYSTVNVNTGLLPPKDFKYKIGDDEFKYDEFPFVLLRTLGGEDNEEKSIVSVKLLLGIVIESKEKRDKTPGMEFEPYRKGHKDLLTIIERIRLNFQKNPIIGNYFSFEKPFKWEIYREQPLLHMYGEINMNFRIPQIELEEDY